MPKHKFISILIVFALFSSSSSFVRASEQLSSKVMLDPELKLASGIEQNYLVELYTSEGCSSCPPADRWLSALKTSKKLWGKVIPLAFHVDYWDYIGWKDKFADNEYSERQRRYAREYSESTVYTPGIKLNGTPWLSWRGVELDAQKLDSDQVGELHLSAENGRFSATFEPLAESASMPLKLNVAVLGMGMSTSVKRGENRGRTLTHDFIVLAFEEFANKGQALQWQGNLPKPRFKAPEYALVAWVSGVASQTPIQSIGGFVSAKTLANES